MIRPFWGPQLFLEFVPENCVFLRVIIDVSPKGSVFLLVIIDFGPSTCGCGSKPMLPFWLVGEFATHFRAGILVVGLVDVHWGVIGILGFQKPRAMLFSRAPRASSSWRSRRCSFWPWAPPTAPRRDPRIRGPGLVRKIRQP